MKDYGLVSVVVPIYNVEQFLVRCINSVLVQTYSNYELILVDDGSTDTCGMICDDFTKKYSCVQVIHQKNQGLSAARNAGMGIAKGKYLYFLDSDDYIKDTLLEDNIKFMLDNKSDMVVFGHYEERAEGVFDKGLKEEGLDTLEIRNKSVMMEIMPSVCNRILERRTWEGISFPVGKHMEDMYIIGLLLCKCKKIDYNTNSYYYYNQTNPNSIMTEFKSVKDNNDTFWAYRELWKVLDILCVDDIARNYCIRQCLKFGIKAYNINLLNRKLNRVEEEELLEALEEIVDKETLVPSRYKFMIKYASFFPLINYIDAYCNKIKIFGKKVAKR